MAVTIGQDALGNAIITGDNNQTFVFYGLKELHPELVADIQSGRKRAADIPEAVPLPALTLAIDFEDGTRAQWKIAVRRATGVSVVRGAAAPWRDDAAFEEALDTFWRLSRMPVEKPEDATLLNTAAHRIGEGLTLALTAFTIFCWSSVFSCPSSCFIVSSSARMSTFSGGGSCTFLNRSSAVLWSPV